MTHRSWVRERTDSYERLEFLGDSVLQLAVTMELMRRHPRATEGDLAWMRQTVVSTFSCADAARRGRLHDAFRENAPAHARDGAGAMSQKTRIQAGLAEAVIGAAWLDLGRERTDAGVLAAFAPPIDAATPGQRDPKTTLQERAARGGRQVIYRLDEQVGPPHARVFRMTALIDDRAYGAGDGSSKQAAEQSAAAAALARLDAEGAE